jgi:hypothetical protein
VVFGKPFLWWLVIPTGDFLLIAHVVAVAAVSSTFVVVETVVDVGFVFLRWRLYN